MESWERSGEGLQVMKLQYGYIYTEWFPQSCFQERRKPEDTFTFFTDKRWTPPSEEYTACIMIDRAGREHDVASPGLREVRALTSFRGIVLQETSEVMYFHYRAVQSFSVGL